MWLRDGDGDGDGDDGDGWMVEMLFVLFVVWVYDVCGIVDDDGVCGCVMVIGFSDNVVELWR